MPVMRRCHRWESTSKAIHIGFGPLRLMATTAPVTFGDHAGGS